MALSERTKEWLESGLGNKNAADEIRAALEGLTIADAEAATNIADVGTLATVGAAIGALTAVGVGAVDTACALAADVDARLATIQAAHDAAMTAADARVVTLQTKIDALLAALIAANLMEGP
jgi:hypothetical protein